MSEMNKMKLLLMQKGLRQRDLVRLLMISPSTISLHFNKIWPMPEKYQKQLCKLLGVSKDEISFKPGDK